MGVGYERAVQPPTPLWDATLPLYGTRRPL